MTNIQYYPPLETPVGIVILATNTVVFNSFVLPLSATHVPASYGGAANAFWADNSGVSIGWTYDGTNFTSPAGILDKFGAAMPIVTVPVASLRRIILVGSS